MAHPPKIRAAVRDEYVKNRTRLELAAELHGVKYDTARRWYYKAARTPDDWDRARNVHLLTDQTYEAIGNQLLFDYLHQHQLIMEQLKDPNNDISAQERVRAITGLADAYNKTLHAFKRMLPELDEPATAITVIDQLRRFVQAQFPDDVQRMILILEAFSPALADFLEKRASRG